MPPSPRSGVAVSSGDGCAAARHGRRPTSSGWKNPVSVEVVTATVGQSQSWNVIWAVARWARERRLRARRPILQDPVVIADAGQEHAAGARCSDHSPDALPEVRIGEQVREGIGTAQDDVVRLRGNGLQLPQVAHAELDGQPRGRGLPPGPRDRTWTRVHALQNYGYRTTEPGTTAPVFGDNAEKLPWRRGSCSLDGSL